MENEKLKQFLKVAGKKSIQAIGTGLIAWNLMGCPDNAEVKTTPPIIENPGHEENCGCNTCKPDKEHGANCTCSTCKPDKPIEPPKPHEPLMNVEFPTYMDWTTAEAKGHVRTAVSQLGEQSVAFQSCLEAWEAKGGTPEQMAVASAVKTIQRDLQSDYNNTDLKENSLKNINASNNVQLVRFGNLLKDSNKKDLYDAYIKAHGSAVGLGEAGKYKTVNNTSLNDALASIKQLGGVEITLQGTNYTAVVNAIKTSLPSLIQDDAVPYFNDALQQKEDVHQFTEWINAIQESGKNLNGFRANIVMSQQEMGM